MSEEWRDIPGYEGRYQVSDQGRVRSIDHYVRSVSRAGTEGKRLVPGKILSPGPQASGHVTVSLGRYNSKQVHQLVMLAFEGPRPEGYEVLHRNHTPSDNRYSNLRYGTRSENILEDFRDGNRKPRQLTPEDIAYVRKRFAEGFYYGEKYQLALRLGCNSGTIHHIINGRNYRSV